MKINKISRAAIAFSLFLGAAVPAAAQVSIQFSLPATQIGVNLGGYPTLARIPGYPVYYAPGVNSNYFFYDGMYWVYQEDDWYASDWYNGPWARVDRYAVPDFVLRVPVRYYRRAPAHFRGWRADAPPRWDQHWGREWNQRRTGWDRWDRKSVPVAAPLPSYQRDYRGDRYPDGRRQAELQNRNYRYQPREDWSRRSYDERRQRGDAGSRYQQDQRRDGNRGQRQSDQRAQEQRNQQAQRAHEASRSQRESDRRAEQARSAEENERTNRRNERGGSGG